jgi:hypothetical protein
LHRLPHIGYARAFVYRLNDKAYMGVSTLSDDYFASASVDHDVPRQFGDGGDDGDHFAPGKPETFG